MSSAAPAATVCKRSGVNRNQGAESTLAYLWTELSNKEVQHLYGDNPKAAVASE